MGCCMLGKSERVKAPTALPTAMESAFTCPGDPEGSATEPISVWRYRRAMHHVALTEEAVPLCSGLPVGVRPQASPAKIMCTYFVVLYIKPCARLPRKQP